LEQAPQRHLAVGLGVDQSGVLLEDVEALLARGVLELLDRSRVEEVQLAVATPLVLAVVDESVARAGSRVVGARVQGQHGASDVLERDAAEARVKPREEAVEHLVGDPTASNSWEPT